MRVEIAGLYQRRSSPAWIRQIGADRGTLIEPARTVTFASLRQAKNEKRFLVIADWEPVLFRLDQTSEPGTSFPS
jgi:hypothetical protein